MDNQTGSSLVEDSAIERFRAVQNAFNTLLRNDFPDFSVAQYADEKAAAEGVDQETLGAKIWAQARSVPARLDVTGDGKIDLDDALMAADQAADQVRKGWDYVLSIDTDDVKTAASAVGRKASETGKRVISFDYFGAAKRAGQKVKETAQDIDHDTLRSSGRTIAKLAKTATGVQGLQNRKIARTIRDISEAYVDAAEAVMDERRAVLYDDIEAFGELRLTALHETLGRFLAILEALKQHNRMKEYELLDAIDIDTDMLDAMGSLDMTVTQNLTASAVTGALGLVAVLGTPALVTASVGALATASTGTAIATLSGAAYSNAVLAWLGGGALAAGGGGIAAGSVVLAGITAGATAGVTVLAAGILLSTHYASKLTEAKTHQKDVALAVANLENAWLVMDGIRSRINELSAVTRELKTRLTPLLTELESRVPTFDSTDSDDVTVFNQCGLLVKTMVELAQVPLLGDDGDLTTESMSITTHVKKVLNTEV